MFWNILIMFNGFYSALSYPYYMTTEFPSINSDGWIIIFFSESLFLLDIVLCFFKQDLDEEGISKQDPLIEIAEKYFKGPFFLDFITFLPMGYFLTLYDYKLGIIWALKAMRIRTLNRQISDEVLMPIINSFIEKQQKEALKDPFLRNDILTDRIYIARKVYTVNIVKTLRQLYQICFIAYFYGQLWFMFSQTLFEFLYNISISDEEQAGRKNDGSSYS